MPSSLASLPQLLVPVFAVQSASPDVDRLQVRDKDEGDEGSTHASHAAEGDEYRVRLTPERSCGMHERKERDNRNKAEDGSHYINESSHVGSP